MSITFAVDESLNSIRRIAERSLRPSLRTNVLAATVLQYATACQHDGALAGYLGLCDAEIRRSADEPASRVRRPGSHGCAATATLLERIDRPSIAIRRHDSAARPVRTRHAARRAPGYCVVDGQIVQGITWTQVAGTFHVLQEYATVGPARRRHDVSGRSVPSSPPIRTTTTRPTGKRPMRRRSPTGEPHRGRARVRRRLSRRRRASRTSASATRSTPPACRWRSSSRIFAAARACAPIPPRRSTSRAHDLRHRLHHRAADVGARCARAAADVRALGRASSRALLRFVERGAAIVATLTADDLGAHENGSEAPTGGRSLARTRKGTAAAGAAALRQLPARPRGQRAVGLAHHHRGDRRTRRRAADLDGAGHGGAARRNHAVRRSGSAATRYRFSLDNNWLTLEPTDCVEIPVDGRDAAGADRRGQLQDRRHSRDRSAARRRWLLYLDRRRRSQRALGRRAGRPGNGPICPSGVGAARHPAPAASTTSTRATTPRSTALCPDSWTLRGALPQQRRRRDLSAAWRAPTPRRRSARSTTSPAPPPTRRCRATRPPYDTTNSITVTLFEGTLASITDAQIAAGQNPAAIGVDGRWVIIQFKTATLRHRATRGR